MCVVSKSTVACRQVSNSKKHGKTREKEIGGTNTKYSPITKLAPEQTVLELWHKRGRIKKERIVQPRQLTSKKHQKLQYSCKSD